MAKEAEHEFVSLNEFKMFETVGDYIQGTFIGWHWISIAGKPIKQFEVYDENVGITKFNGTTTMEILAHITPGTTVRVTYLGEEKVTVGKVRKFAIDVPRLEMKSMIAAMVASGGVKFIAPPSEVVPDADADPFADDAKYEQPPHPASV